MTNYAKESFKLFGLHLVFALASVLFLGSFAFVAGNEIASKIYSSITALIYLSALYSSVWQAGRKDWRFLHVANKNLPPEQQGKLNLWKGLIIGLFAAIPSVFMLGLFVHASHTGGMYYAWVNMAYRIYQSAFLSWLGNDNLSYFWNCVIVTAIPPVLSGIAYVAGTKQFSVIERYLPGLVYKKKKTNKTKK